MARTREHPASPQQLTLDDWEQTLSAARKELKAERTKADVDVPASVGAAGKKGAAVRSGDARPAAARARPVAIELLAVPEALLTRTHLRQLGLERRAIDAIFRALPVVA